MQVTFDPQDFKADFMEQVSEVTEWVTTAVISINKGFLQQFRPLQYFTPVFWNQSELHKPEYKRWNSTSY